MISLGHVAAIREDKDAVSSAQTDSISLQKKMEEIKDGVKGAPAPSFEFYKQQGFMEPHPAQTPSPENHVVMSANREDISEVDLNEEEEAPSEDSLTSEKPVSEDETEDSWWNEEDSGSEEK